jgi:hypothetical protein
MGDGTEGRKIQIPRKHDVTWSFPRREADPKLRCETVVILFLFDNNCSNID